MKKFKKILALALSLAMVLGMSVTTFAASTAGTPAPGGTPGEAPKSTDKAAITVTNVEAGATVTAYQIVKAKYNDGFTGYEALTKTVEGVEVPLVADVLKPTSEEVGDIAANISSYNLKSEVLQPVGNAETATTYSAKVNAGYWIVLVTQTSSNQIYNPMLLGAYYTVSGSNNMMSNETVGADMEWTLEGTTAYPKKTTPEIRKYTVVDNEDKKGDDVGIWSTVQYKIVSDIPTYSKEYTSVTYEIADTISEGLTFGTTTDKTTYTKNVTVKCGEDNLLDKTVAGSQAKVATVSYDKEDATAKTMTIRIDSAYILANGGKEIVVEYSATLNDKASVNLKPNTNTATLSYTNNPDTSADPATVTSKTYHYTFALDSGLYGDDGTTTTPWNKITEELVKINEGVAEKVTTVIKGETYEITTTRLYGAEFALKQGDATVATATSDIYGHLAFRGLDAGEYKLVETKAPDGYSLNTAMLDVEISATYRANGTLDTYTVKVGNISNTYMAKYATTESDEVIGFELVDNATDKKPVTVENDSKIDLPSKVEKVEGETRTDVTKDMVTLTKDDIVSNASPFTNTKLSSLPSTGGIGTTIFTIGGCAIMIIAAGLYFASRRRSAK